jgi:hypothetical protein
LTSLESDLSDVTTSYDSKDGTRKQSVRGHEGRTEESGHPHDTGFDARHHTSHTAFGGKEGHGRKGKNNNHHAHHGHKTSEDMDVDDAMQVSPSHASQDGDRGHVRDYGRVHGTEGYQGRRVKGRRISIFSDKWRPLGGGEAASYSSDHPIRPAAADRLVS